MKNDDIEILEDLPEAPSNNSNPIFQQQSMPQPIQQPNIVDNNQNVSSANEFEKMMAEPINEVKNDPKPVEKEQPEPLSNTFSSLPIADDYKGDVNNSLVESNDEKELTITAIYPNGFVVPDEEPEEKVVEQPKKKGSDLFLVIVVAVLAITLVVMLVIFYV